MNPEIESSFQPVEVSTESEPNLQLWQKFRQEIANLRSQGEPHPASSKSALDPERIKARTQRVIEAVDKALTENRDIYIGLERVYHRGDLLVRERGDAADSTADTPGEWEEIAESTGIDIDNPPSLKIEKWEDEDEIYQKTYYFTSFKFGTEDGRVKFSLTRKEGTDPERKQATGFSAELQVRSQRSG